MGKALRYVAIALAALAALAVIAAAIAVWMGDRKRERTLDVAVKPVAYADGAEVLARGRYLFDSRGCMECHGANGAGKVFIDSPDGLHVRSPNLTRGSGGAAARYNEADWVRAIRHGVGPDRRPLLIMPSEDYNRLTDGDLAALVAYIRSLPPVAGERAVVRMPLMLRALYGVGAMHDAAGKIDHARPPERPVAAGATREHGAYVTNMCIGCHGGNLSGGKIPGAPPQWPSAANLTPGEGSGMQRYERVEQFVAMMRTGKRPDGSAVSAVMPFESLKNFNDVDLQGMFVYLKSLPARPAGGR